MAEEQAVTETTNNDHHDSDTVTLLGRQFTIYGGIYTVVFIGLAILTVIEVAMGSIKAGWTIPLLLGMALAKAALVVLYYMHLRTDSRIFALVLLLPLGMALLSVLYLLAVPPTGY
ncbi:MAG: cytochrome C oxidase subunit IV family protein [Anaerolineae bacterium]|nr:cytochrome C oxidase subunit IV family protein [Anaerolineae bacterium]